MEETKRLNKYISSSENYTRGEADELVAKGRVLVNGKVGEIGTVVGPNDVVTIDGFVIKDNKKKVYLAFNKPVGITCTTDQNDPNNIVDYIRFPQKIFPVGRLDKDSEGLIIMTNDGDIVNKILRSSNNHEKEYVVTVNRPVTDDFIKKMGNGVRIHNTITKKCLVKRVRNNMFTIVLTEGLNRQIRLMCERFGYEVVALKRVRIMHLNVKGIEEGTFKEIKGNDLEKLKTAVAKSKNTAEPEKEEKPVKKQNKNNPSVRFDKRKKEVEFGRKKHKMGKKSPIRNKMKSKKRGK